jgi:hypothetical protein
MAAETVEEEKRGNTTEVRMARSSALVARPKVRADQESVVMLLPEW